MSKLEQHRKTWQGKSDEWLFERLANELTQKVEEIHTLIAENEQLRSLRVLPNDTQIEKKAVSMQKPRKPNNDSKEEFIHGFMQGADWIIELINGSEVKN